MTLNAGTFTLKDGEGIPCSLIKTLKRGLSNAVTILTFPDRDPLSLPFIFIFDLI
jgi:hypothetical protein